MAQKHKQVFPTIHPEHLRKALDTDANDSSAIAQPNGTTTRPLGSGIDGGTNGTVRPDGNQCNELKIVPLLDGAANDVSDFAWFGYNEVKANAVWSPILLAHVTCTAGAATIAINGITYQYCDTITFVKGDGETHIVSPGSDFVGYLIVKSRGAQYIQADFDQTTNTPTQNWLYEWN